MPELMAVGRPTGRFGTVQLVAVELALFATGAAVYALSPVPGVLAGTAAAVLLVATFGRSGGRWWYEVLGARLRLARRRRAGLRAQRRSGADDPLLAVLPPGPRTTTITDRSGSIGVGQDTLGWFAAIAVRHPDGLSGGHHTALRLDWLAGLAADPALPASTLQVVLRHSSLPIAAVDPRTAAAQSYLELCRVLSVPVHHDVWIAARLSTRDAATVAADRGGGLAGVHRALTAAIARVGTGLTNLDVEHTVLDGDGLRQALAYSCGVDTAAGLGRERWSRWQDQHRVQVCFAVRAWPATATADPLRALTQVPSALDVSVAVLFGRRDGSGAPDGRAAARTLVRVTTTPELVNTCVQQLRASATAAGVRLVRLNGEHATGVYATAPTGATLGLVAR
ncbi:type VII secretion protein EccE [Plantactinospora sp. KLBMP9567]|uniref:type VII secretion protein EccE n=1 Tax=Plantactinospora sp. KLBMP9567 TaxID=3085900 RepID=UPI002980FB78|nr:type VII secretion protein EccE [Plantactinospora sp. KLBMP9567]MDW5327951.1 type VII secretion protein EccE [Plantactinospora sp. KLBMP9567]